MKDKKIKEEYLLENEKFKNDLDSGIIFFKKIGKQLLNLEIDIFKSPWYKNIIEIYVPQAFELYDECLIKDLMYIYEINYKWMRSSFKSFLSEIEKFVKFITKNSLSINPNTFCSEINNLKEVYLKHKHLFREDSDIYCRQIENIIEILHLWRKVENKNKHETEHLDGNYFTNSKEKSLWAIGSDSL